MKTVLIIDDEFALAETLKVALEVVGYRAEIAANGHEGLAFMRANRPDLVLTDLMMPVMNGKQLLAAMRADPALAAIPAILMTAARRQVAVPPNEPFPEFSTFLRKPFLLRALLEAIVALIGKAD